MKIIKFTCLILLFLVSRKSFSQKGYYSFSVLVPSFYSDIVGVSDAIGFTRLNENDFHRGSVGFVLKKYFQKEIKNSVSVLASPGISFLNFKSPNSSDLTNKKAAFLGYFHSEVLIRKEWRKFPSIQFGSTNKLLLIKPDEQSIYPNPLSEFNSFVSNLKLGIGKKMKNGRSVFVNYQYPVSPMFFSPSLGTGGNIEKGRLYINTFELEIEF